MFKRTGSREAINYDSFEAMDVPLFNQHLSQLIAGHTVETPRYNFKTGNRDYPGHTLTLPANAILVMEGIHALNPAYTASVPAEMKFTIYISPLTQLTLDECSAVKTTNWRLLRRMTRDFLFRGHSAEKTLSMWDRVREGEVGVLEWGFRCVIVIISTGPLDLPAPEQDGLRHEQLHGV